MMFPIIMQGYLQKNLSCMKQLTKDEFQINCSVKKSVSGTYHQGNLKYGETVGMQCTSNAFFAICFPAIKSVSIWKSWDLDYILDQGDQLIKSLKVNHPLGNGAIFSCADFSCALIWTKKSMFGTHSRNSQGVLVPSGQSVLLEFRSITALNLFIMKYYEKNCDSTSTLQCDIRYIKLETSKTAAQNVLDSLEKQRNKLRVKNVYQKNPRPMWEMLLILTLLVK